MQYDAKDLLIWTTGLVGRALGSGKFGYGDIGDLTKAALEAFEEQIAPKLAQSAPAPSHAPSASGGPQKPDWHAGAAAVASGEIPAETKSFSMWGGDKAYIFGRPEALWADWLEEARNGDAAALEALHKQAKASLGKDPKWHAANQKRIARAKACLNMLAQGGK